ncbi:hypothetical protein [Pseudomonas sp. Leaf127]|uniref:hypothetical protein n=1 Tax=Pseudomonas sp. Leaf127 TaxID=1736267 RepID=UPI000ABA26F1|nr:hypothetical protein [Pseudomonas sp. Leaf127]
MNTHYRHDCEPDCSAKPDFCENTMLESNKHIALTGEEALEVLAEIEFILISLHQMGSYYRDKPVAQYRKATTDFIDDENVTHRLAKARKIISRKFDATLGEDEMDDIERHLQSLRFWKP